MLAKTSDGIRAPELKPDEQTTKLGSAASAQMMTVVKRPKTMRTKKAKKGNNE